MSLSENASSSSPSRLKSSTAASRTRRAKASRSVEISSTDMVPSAARMWPSRTSCAVEVMPLEPLERKFSTARWSSVSSVETLTWPYASAEMITPWAVSTSGQRTEIENTSIGNVSTLSTNGRTKVPPPTCRR